MTYTPNTARKGLNTRVGKESYIIQSITLSNDAEYGSDNYDIDLRSEGVYITTRETNDGVFYLLDRIDNIRYHIDEPAKFNGLTDDGHWSM